jgi:hypothetical protein
MEQLCASLQLRIGGRVIDDIPATWLRVYDELYRSSDERQAYKVMANFDPLDPPGCTRTMYMPLPFWFCRGDPAKALPLAALEHHEVDIVLTLPRAIPGVDAAYHPKLELSCEYVVLDGPERALLTQPGTEREILIDVLQVAEAPIAVDESPHTYRIDVKFNHPCTSLVWCARGNQHGVFTGSGRPLESSEAYAPLDDARLVLDGVDRAAPRPGSWFRLADPFLKSRRKVPSAGVYVWDFCLDPTRGAPSGSINMSRFDDARLYVTTKKAAAVDTPAYQPLDVSTTTLPGARALHTVTVMAPSWNWLVIKDGMAGIKYR